MKSDCGLHKEQCKRKETVVALIFTLICVCLCMCIHMSVCVYVTYLYIFFFLIPISVLFPEGILG